MSSLNTFIKHSTGDANQFNIEKEIKGIYIVKQEIR